MTVTVTEQLHTGDRQAKHPPTHSFTLSSILRNTQTTFLYITENDQN